MSTSLPRIRRRPFMVPGSRSAAAALMSIALIGCQTTDPYTGETKTSNTAKGSGIGAVSGAAIGALADGRKGALIGAGIGALAGGAVGNYMDRQEAELRQQLGSTGVSVERNGNDLILRMPGDVTFATGSAELAQRFQPVLGSVATVLKKYEKTYVDVIGHTDSTGGDALNQRLSEQRASNVASYLSGNGVVSERLITAGVGSSTPVASNQTAQGRQQNRRVEIKLTPLT